MPRPPETPDTKFIRFIISLVLALAFGAFVYQFEGRDLYWSGISTLTCFAICMFGGYHPK